MTPMDRSQIYDLDDESPAQRPARFALILTDNRAVYAETEEDIASVQRIWRVLNGFDPITGEPGYAGDYVISHDRNPRS